MARLGRACAGAEGAATRAAGESTAGAAKPALGGTGARAGAADAEQLGAAAAEGRGANSRARDRGAATAAAAGGDFRRCTWGIPMAFSCTFILGVTRHCQLEEAGKGEGNSKGES